MNNLQKFNPEISASKVKELWGQRQKVSIEIVTELYKARYFYNGLGNNQYSVVPTGTTLNSFEKYLNSISFPKRTAYNWLERYIPEENKLLSYDELEKIKESEKEAQKSQKQKDEELRIRRIKAEEKEFEAVYKSGISPVYDTEKMKRYQSFKNVKDFIAAGKTREKKNQEEAAAREKRHEQLSSDVDSFLKAEKEKAEFRIKHLSKVENLETFYDVIDDYVSTLNSEDRKLEAYNGIIKYCRGKANALHHIKREGK